MAINNKDLIQSYVMTAAKYDFNVYEKRIIYRLVEMAQGELQGIHFKNSCYKIEHDLFDFTNITMPIADLLIDEDDKNYAPIKEAVQSLQHKLIEYEDEEVWESFSIIAFGKIRRYGSTLNFIVHPKIWDCALQFSKGFRKFELATAMRFKSQYSMRFYEIVSGQKSPLVYTIEQLRSMFGLLDKYSLTADFLRYVVDAAKKELDEYSPYTFEYTPIKDGKKITAIKLFPKYQAKNRDQDLEGKDATRQLWSNWYITAEVREYLKNSLEFTEREIRNNHDVFCQAQQVIPDLLLELSLLKGKAREKKRPKGYIINALRGKIRDYQMKSAE